MLKLDNVTFLTNNTGSIAPFFYVGIGSTNAGNNADGLPYINGFCPSCGDFSVGLTGQGGGPVSTAEIDGLNVNLTGVNWIINNVFGQNYDLSFDAQTILGAGVALVKSNVACTRFSGDLSTPGTTCADNVSASNPLGPVKSGYGFDLDLTNQSAIGTACVSSNAANNPQCSVNVVLSEDGQRLTVEIRKALSETSSGFQAFTLNYVVPLPAAAWLMISAMGSLAMVRRRRQAAT